MLKKMYPILVGAIFFAFPFLIHFGLPYLHPVYFAVILFVLLLMRILLNSMEGRLANFIVLTVSALYCTSVALFDSELLLRYYPVLMSLYFSLLFFLSLFDEVPLIERFVILSGKTYPAEAKPYLRTLTKSWVILLMINALISGYSACCGSNQFWLLYNGFISYLLIIGFILGELVFRQYYRRIHNI